MQAEWWLHSNPTCCNQICLNLLYRSGGNAKTSSLHLHTPIIHSPRTILWTFNYRQQSCWKVMFSEASVILLGDGVGTSNASSDRWHGRVTSDVAPNLCYWHLVMITGNLFKLVHMRTYPPPQLVLTSSGGYRNMYRWQAGGTHPSGILSWYFCHRLLVTFILLGHSNDSRYNPRYPFSKNKETRKKGKLNTFDGN